MAPDERDPNVHIRFRRRSVSCSKPEEPRRRVALSHDRLFRRRSASHFSRHARHARLLRKSCRRSVSWTNVHASSRRRQRSEEHTSELQSLAYLVCRLLLEKKKKKKNKKIQ